MTSSGPVLYDGEIDFAALALKDADFAQVLNEQGRLDFHNPRCVKQLTASLLKRDFGLKIELPDDRLCPPVPVRYNYIRWLQSLIDTTSPAYSEAYDPSRQVIGVDVGVGASCIYPLLACASRPNWLMGGSELDFKSFSHASHNISLNNLQSRIRIVNASVDGPLLPLDKLGLDRADFTMCNPPFFSSRAEMAALAASKSAPPSAVCTGADVEMVCEGGDLGFALRMVKESCHVHMRDRVQWFSSMLGKWVSVEGLVKRLKEVGVSNWAVKSLMPEGKGRTQRWAVAWSFGDVRPSADVARRDTPSNLAPFPPRYVIPLSPGNFSSGYKDVVSTLQGLDMRWRWSEEHLSGIGVAKGNVWSRAARRKKKRVEADMGNKTGERMDEDESGAVALCVKIIISKRQIEVRWLQGLDGVLFESFCGMLKRAMS